MTKSVEVIFKEIIHLVDVGQNAPCEYDCDEVIFSESCFSKMRRFTGNYRYTNYIDISDGLMLWYYFSNTISRTWFINSSGVHAENCILSTIVENLFDLYNIDSFIHGLNLSKLGADEYVMLCYR